MNEEEPLLKFPIIKGNPMPPPVLSMDQYVEFVQFFVQHLNQKAYEEDRRLSIVNVAFRLK